MSLKYDEHGNEYRLIKVHKGQCLVSLQILNEDGEPLDGELRLIHESTLHANPPRSKINSQIVMLKTERENLRQQIFEIKKELKTFDAEIDKRKSRLKQHESLKLLEDFMAGNISHYVEQSSYGPPTIVSFESSKNDAYNRRDKLKLLTLFGRTDGDLEWGLNRYSDGSGSNTTVTPCTSYDEAVEVASKIFAEHAQKALAPDDRTSPSQDWIKRAKQYDITMTPDYLQQFATCLSLAKDKQIAELESKLKEARSQ